MGAAVDIPQLFLLPTTRHLAAFILPSFSLPKNARYTSPPEERVRHRTQPTLDISGAGGDVGAAEAIAEELRASAHGRFAQLNGWGKYVAQDSDGLVVTLVIAVVFLVFDTLPPKNTPCVYDHGGIVDWVGTNARKRTCAEFMTEANSRITAQQVQIRDAVEKLDQANSILALQSQRGDSPDQSMTASAATTAAASEAPTLTANYRPADNDDDDDN